VISCGAVSAAGSLVDHPAVSVVVASARSLLPWKAGRTQQDLDQSGALNRNDMAYTLRPMHA